MVGSKVNVGAGVVGNEVLPQLARPAYVPAIAVNTWVAVQPVLAGGVEACMSQSLNCRLWQVLLLRDMSVQSDVLRAKGRSQQYCIMDAYSTDGCLANATLFGL